MILAIDPGNIESVYVFTKDNLEVVEIWSNVDIYRSQG